MVISLLTILFAICLESCFAVGPKEGFAVCLKDGDLGLVDLCFFVVIRFVHLGLGGAQLRPHESRSKDAFQRNPYNARAIIIT